MNFALSNEKAAAWLRVCNRSSETAYVAVAYLDTNDNRDAEFDNGWVSEGWWAIVPDACAQVYPHELWRRNRYYYVYAKGKNGGEWSGRNSFCVTNGAAFTNRGANADCDGRNQEWKRFDQIDIGGGKIQNYTYSLGD